MIDPKISARLGLLIPRLASTHDGEVVATARAIERTLHSAAADWHDLAATVTSKLAVVDPPLMNLLSMADALNRLENLNAWEAKFVRDIMRLLHAGARLTEKQDQALRRCYARHGDRNET